jgi:hypothetical protein
MTQALLTTHDPEAYKAEQVPNSRAWPGRSPTFFKSYPEDQAIVRSPTHINQFWSGACARISSPPSTKESSPSCGALVADQGTTRITKQTAAARPHRADFSTSLDKRPEQ